MSIKNINISLSIFLCFILIVLSLIIPYQQVHASVMEFCLSAFAIPEAVPIIATILVAAGAVCLTAYAINKLANYYYDNCHPYVKEQLSNAIHTAHDGIVEISDEIWTNVTDFVDRVVIANSSSNLSIADYTVNIDGILYPFTPITESIDLWKNIYPINTLVVNGVVYTLQVVYNDMDWEYVYILNIDGTAGPIFRSPSSDGVMALVCQSPADGLRLRLFVGGNWHDLLQVPNSNTFPEVQASTGSEQIAITGDVSVSNPDRDFKTPSKPRTLTFPETVDGVVSKTSEQVISGDISSGEPENPPTETGFWGSVLGFLSSFWDSLLNALSNAFSWLHDFISAFWSNLSTAVTGALSGVTGVLTDIWDWLKDFFSALTGVLSNALAPVITAIASIADSISSTAEPPTDSAPPNYDLPDLFWLLILMIIGFIKLVLKGLTYLFSLYNVSADSSMLNTDFLSGFEFLKNQNIPYFGVSILTIVQSLGTVLFGLALIKTGKKFLLSLNSQSLLNRLKGDE